MTEHLDESEQSLPLLKAGWRQGVMFDAPGASYGLNILSSDGTLERGQPRAVRPQRSERLVLISHLCDIRGDAEKYVEALICKKHDPNDGILDRWDQNSPRYFIVEPESAYVADASHRIKIAKSALTSLNHYGLSMDEDRLLRFVEWLTRRYDRPTVPDAVYERFHDPVYQALRTLAQHNPEVWRDFNAATRDIRVSFPEETHPPCAVGLIYLTIPALTQRQAEAIGEVHRTIGEATLNGVRVLDPPVIMDIDEVPFGVVRRTQPLIVEYFSWRDAKAAPPAWILERQGE